MCGIVGYVGSNDAVPVLLEGLKRLEYRGYDSAGVAVLDAEGQLQVRKREGKLAELVAELRNGTQLSGHLGIGHTRWATHGPPTTRNAHPHQDSAGGVVVVHNGIIENYAELREELRARGHTFSSDTDTEVVANLVASELNGDLASAVRRALARLEGAFALAIFSVDAPDTLVAARRFSPLVVGAADGEAFVASDIPALLGRTRRVMPLDDDQIAVLSADGIVLTDMQGRSLPLEFITVDWDPEAAEKGGYEHFVRKEIDEQPQAIGDTLVGRFRDGLPWLEELDALELEPIRRIYIVAAGSSFYAGLAAKHLIEAWARLPVEVAIASEIRYADPVLGPDSLVVLVTQSGETADTLAALRSAADAGAPTLAVTNVVGSSVTRGADVTLFLQVGPEIGVVATKTFTGQIALLTALAGDLARRRGTLQDAALRDLAAGLRSVPEAVGAALGVDAKTADLAKRYANRRSMFFVGRGVNHPIALEAALKLKEISYVHAEGYPAGELKHGPIAMLEPGWPVMAFATPSRTYEKVLSGIEEVKARGAEVIAVAAEGDKRVRNLVDHVVTVPEMPELLSPAVNVIPAQLFAYHVAVALGRDVDQPRNLAKSVTVE